MRFFVIDEHDLALHLAKEAVKEFEARKEYMRVNDPQKKIREKNERLQREHDARYAVSYGDIAKMAERVKLK